MARSRHYYEKYSVPPLKFQLERGYQDFRGKKQWTNILDTGATVVITANPYPLYTMQAKEWQRGYDKAYFENLNEHRTRG